MRDLAEDMILDTRGAPMFPVEAQGLRYAAKGQPLVDGIDLSLPRDGITMVMGANGSGKSLLLRLLNGLIAPSGGWVRYGGEPLSKAHRERLALVFQKPVLLRRSVAANVAFVLKARGLPGDPAPLLNRVGLAAKARQPARQLSGGEAQRLALARALALDPAILYLDEPTASLDPASVLAIEQIVTDARDAGTKIVFVTHDIGQARRLADDIVFLHRGRVTEHRAAADFFDAPQSDSARAYLAGRIHL